MGAETSPSAASSEPTIAQTPVPADHPGVADLFAVLAYGEISAFYRLAEDAKLSPTLRGRVALASMAAAEMSHFETLQEALESRGVEIYAAMEPFRRSLDAYHACTTPSTWLESLVKAHVGDGIAADFYREIAGTLAPEVASVVREVLAETGHSDFVIHEVRAAVEKSSLEKDRLMLWGRRLLGEAITQAQYVMAQQENLAELVITATGDLTNIAALFDRMQVEHAKRMAVLGLH
ncbi:ferritin-like fold-containing protein [Rhodococcus sp. NPDC003383]